MGQKPRRSITEPFETAQLIGKLVDGRYRILERIGRGGMAEVYLAEQVAVRRPVALKILHPRFERSDDLPRRFRHEAQAASRLNHPNIVMVHDFGEADGHLYIAMEYVRGNTLSHLCEGRPMDVERACTLVSQVCAALQDAHDNGVVHCDLKAENVLVAGELPNERVKVLDFGISRILIDPSASAEEEPEVRFGTPLVVAPEILLGQPANAASDLYSLGVVFYEVLAGEPPFSTQSVKHLLADHLHTEPPGFDRALRIPPTIEALVQQLLNKKPADRPTSMREVAERIAAWTRAPDWPSRSTSPPLATPPPELPPEHLAAPVRALLSNPGGLDFPAFAAQVTRINALCDDDDVEVGDLAALVLQDLGVTDRILRLVNSSFYRRTRRPVATVTRAIKVLGVEQVRRAALGLGFWEHLRRGGDREALLDGALSSMASALLARDLAADVEGVESEEAFLCALFRRMGRHLVMHHLPAEYARIHALTNATPPQREADAAKQVLGMSFEAIGGQVAEHLGYPEYVARAAGPEVSTPPTDAAGRLQALAVLSNALVDECAAHPDDRSERVAELTARYGAALGLTPERANAALDEAAEEMVRRAETLGVDADTRVMKALAPRPPRLTPPIGAIRVDPLASLTQALPEVRSAVDRGDPIEDVTTMVLEAMYRGASFQRVLFCLRVAKERRMRARLAFGPQAAEAIDDIDFSLDGPSDLVLDALRSGEPLLVRDARLPSVRSQLPEWFLDRLGAPAFALFPVMVRGEAVAMLYGDSARPQLHPDWIDDDHRAVLRGLVDALVLGFQKLGERKRRKR